MGVRDTRVGEAERSTERAESAPDGQRGVVARVRHRLAEWSRVHARMQVELLAGQPRDR